MYMDATLMAVGRTTRNQLYIKHVEDIRLEQNVSENSAIETNYIIIEKRMKEEPTKMREKAARQAETERYGYGSGDGRGNSDESGAGRSEEGDFY